MKKFVTRFIAVFSVLMVFSLQAAPQIDLQQLMLDAERNPEIQFAAKKLAKQQGLPSNVTLADGTFMYPLGIENGEVVYAVIQNLAHPLQNGSTAFWSEIQAEKNLSGADIYYAGDKLRHQPTTSAKRVNTLVLIPESTNDGVIALDFATGDLVDANYIPPSPDPLSTPLMARATPTGTISVSDQIEDLILQFDTAGALIDTLAPAGGLSPDTLNNVRGHTYLPNGNILATVASGANANSIAEFDPTGNYLGNFIDIDVGGLDSPWDIQFRENDILITSIDTDDIRRYDLSGTFLDVFGQTTNFPQQVHEDADGNVLVGVFSNPETGVVIYDAAGTLQRTLLGISGNRGAFRLGNGNVITTNGAGIFELDFNTGAIIRNTVAGVSARLIETDVVPSNTVTLSYPFTEDMESGVWPPAGWTEYHTGVDTLVLTDLRANSPVFSANFADADLTDSSWFVSPQITNIGPGAELTFFENINFGSFYVYHGLYVSTGSPNPADGDFVEVDSLPASTEDVWEANVMDFSAYEGQDIYIAWLYVGDFADEWYLDDISLDVPAQVENNPPIGFVAEAAGFEANLSWNPPLPEPLLGYDDGTDEGNISIGDNGTTATGELAVRFTPQIYPTTILDAQVLFTVADTSANSVDMTTVDVKIYDGDDVTGPTTELYTANYPIVNRDVDFDVFDLSAGAVTVSSGDFFISLVEASADSLLGLAWDANSPDNVRSWVDAPNFGLPWQTFAATGIAGFDNNSMIRVVVQEGSGPNARIRVLYSDGTSSALTDIKDQRASKQQRGITSFDFATFSNPTELEKIEHLLGGVTAQKAGPGFPSIEVLEGYNVYRSEDGVTFSQIATVADSVLTYTDTNPPTNTTVTYYAAAQYTLGEGLPSNTDSIFIGASAPFPFSESWPDSGVIDPAKWSATADIGVIDSTGVSTGTFPFPVPSEPYFVSVNNADSRLTSNPIDLSAQSNVTLSMWESEHDLEVGESCFLEYTDANGDWQLLNEFPGTNNGFGTYEPFEEVSFPLPADAYHAAFQFRFRMSITGVFTTDEWFFDDISLDVGGSSGETNPPRDLAAAVNGFSVDLTWRAPLPEGTTEIAYDDGSPEGNISIGAANDGEIANRFTPNVYPTTLVQVVVQFGDSPTASPSTNLTIYDGNSTTGPGSTLLTQPYTTSQRGQFAIIDVESANIQITADDFFVSFSENTGETMNLDWDTSSPTAGRAWINAPGLGFPWQPFANINATFDNNLLVRAVVREGTGPSARLVVLEEDGSRTPLTITEYKELLAANEHVASRAGAVNIDGSAVATGPSKPAAGDEAVSRAGIGVGSGIAALTGYNLYRSDDGGASYSVIASPDSAATTFNDNTAPRNVEVFYYLTAVYTGGEGLSSDTVSATIVDVFESIANHETPEFRTAATNEGTIGMLNAFGGTPGFEWPLGTNQLFEGAVMVGIAPDQVSDGARVIVAAGQNSLDEDFGFVTNVDTVSSTADETIYRAVYDDSNHPNGPQADDGPNAAIPVDVVQTTYSYTDADNSGYLIMKIQVVNTGSATLNDVLVGQYHDWDINAFASNTGEVVFDITQVAGENNDLPFEMEFARLFDATGPVPYIGAVPLSQNVFLSSWILDNASEVFPGGASPLSEANKYNYMLNRRATDPFGDPVGPADKSLVFGVGGGADGDATAGTGYTIAPGDTITTGVALVGGNDAADFIANGKAALQKWSDLGNDITVFAPIYTGIEDDLAGIPTEFSLDQNYPNPFNPTTTIKYGLKEASDVELTVYNMLGQKVRTLVSAQQTAGYQSIQWDGRNDNGAKVASGIYIYKLSANDFVSSRKLILMK